MVIEEMLKEIDVEIEEVLNRNNCTIFYNVDEVQLGDMVNNQQMIVRKI